MKNLLPAYLLKYRQKQRQETWLLRKVDGTHGQAPAVAAVVRYLVSASRHIASMRIKKRVISLSPVVMGKYESTISGCHCSGSIFKS